MQDNFHKPIFVLGLPRSGTSMVAGILSLCGVWTGSTVPGGPANPKGFFEHTVIRERIVKHILVSVGYDPLGVKTLPPVDISGTIPGLSDVLKRIIENDGYAQDVRWLYKDAKLTLIWPLFHHAFPSATWLIVNRDIEGFVQSCLHTGFMNQHSGDEHYWHMFAGQYQARLDALRASGADVMEISSPGLVSGDRSELLEIIDRLGLQYDKNAIDHFIAPEHWHTLHEN
jgi:hypothetical protein